jgi:hypothetical protein
MALQRCFRFLCILSLLADSDFRLTAICWRGGLPSGQLGLFATKGKDTNLGRRSGYRRSPPEDRGFECCSLNLCEHWVMWRVGPICKESCKLGIVTITMPPGPLPKKRNIPNLYRKIVPLSSWKDLNPRLCTYVNGKFELFLVSCGCHSWWREVIVDSYSVCRHLNGVFFNQHNQRM